MFRDILIGEKAEIIYNKKKFEGIIIDETKNTLLLFEEDKKKRLLKKSIIIKINNKFVEGKNLLRRAEDRIKD